MMHKMCSLKTLVNIYHGIPICLVFCRKPPGLWSEKKVSRYHQTNFPFLWEWLFLSWVDLSTPLWFIQNSAYTWIMQLIIFQMFHQIKFPLNMKLRHQILIPWPLLSWLESTFQAPWEDWNSDTSHNRNWVKLSCFVSMSFSSCRLRIRTQFLSFPSSSLTPALPTAFLHSWHTMVGSFVTPLWKPQWQFFLECKEILGRMFIYIQKKKNI